MRVIGLDVGEKRIGVAKADSSTRIAIPVGFINVDGSEWREIARIARLNSTNLFVIGLPRSNEGNETAQSRYVRAFAKTLIEKVPGARIKLQDESLTSVMAEERLKSRKKKYEKGDIDAEAASIILQDFLEGLTGKGFSDTSPANTLEPLKPSLRSAGGASERLLSDKALQELQNAKGIAKKQSDKVILNTKKAKHKMKTATKWMTAIIILVILGLLGTGIALMIREKKHQDYLAWLAEQEAQMVPEVFNFTILPGENIFDIKKKLVEVGYSETEVDEALNAQYDFDFLKGRPEGATLEGYLFGETIEFYKSATAKEIIETFLKEMGKVIEENQLEQKYSAQGLSLFEGITLASVVQKEASPPEQPTVAQVFLSRMGYGIPLGSDVTVSYALDVVDPDRVTYKDNQAALKIDSCYNTRLYAGLPCGPISNPSLTALLAVAAPSDTTYLYFLTGDDGLMYYSYTEYEHNQNARTHCKELCNVSL
ncbi:endolytic transglycosylase MltG [Candidatus Saccharibacteria bacterium]|nr:endolytic transglycosylase MltG [Candidatus Saccharibacteria bacterium]